MRLWQGLASSNITITKRFIVNSYIETGGIFIVYLPPLSMVAVLDLHGNKKKIGRSLKFGTSILGNPLGMGNDFNLSMCVKIQS